MKFHNPDFNLKHLQFLHERALDHERIMKRWLKNKNYDFVAEAANKLEAVVELMENITVMSHGDGLDCFSKWGSRRKNMHERLHSFDKLLKGVNVPTRT